MNGIGDLKLIALGYIIQRQGHILSQRMEASYEIMEFFKTKRETCA